MRVVNPSRRTYVYRNLRRNCLSLMQQQLVVGHAQAVILTDVEFRVRPSGRQKVLEQKQKNVHAFAVGKLSVVSNQLLAEELFFASLRNGASPLTTEHCKLITVSYNPYRFGYFFNVETLEPVITGKRALVTTKAIYVEV